MASTGIRALVIASAATLWTLPVFAQTVQSARFDIARYGAACLMGATEIEVHPSTDVVSVDTITAQSGAPADLIQSWAATRAKHYAVATEVLYALRDEDGGWNDPPEPFLTILLYAQSDCQDAWRSRNVLAAATDRLLANGGTVPPLTPLVLTDRFAEKMLDDQIERLAWVIHHAPDAIEAGFGDEVHRLAEQMAGTAITLGTMHDGATLTDARNWARRLLTQE